MAIQEIIGYIANVVPAKYPRRKGFVFPILNMDIKNGTYTIKFKNKEFEIKSGRIVKHDNATFPHERVTRILVNKSVAKRIFK